MNHHPELGISRSMQLGIEAAGDADAYMFCVCDQPWLTPATVGRLIEEYRAGKAGIVSLAWQGKMCNPKIFSSRYREELMSLTGDTGGRQIISSHPDDLLLVEAASIEETMDIDRPIHTASTHSVSRE
jgi:molybdenum cofactor cytidylyltransferase